MDSVDKRLAHGLFALRFTIAWFLMQWAVEKFVKPEGTAKIFAAFYQLPVDVDLAPVLGGVQAIIVLAFLTGFLKKWSYGLVLLMHGVTTAVTWRSIVMPFADGSSHLFTTGVPVLAACWVLFYLRDRDTLFSIDAARAAKASSDSRGHLR